MLVDTPARLSFFRNHKRLDAVAVTAAVRSPHQSELVDITAGRALCWVHVFRF